MADTKPFDPTARCQNCGGLRREHHVRKPYRCPTRLAESYWLPWTVEAYEKAEAAASVRVTLNPERPQEQPEDKERIVHLLRRMREVGQRILKEEAEKL